MGDLSKPIGWELAERHPERFRRPMPLSLVERGPCGVCGFPGGDCVDDRLLGDHPPMTRTEREMEPVVLVEDAYEDVSEPGRSRMARRLRYRRGTVVRRWQAEESGARHEQQQVIRPKEAK